MIENYVDHKELTRLISALLIVLGCLVIAGLFAAIVVPGLRNANKAETPMPVTPAVGETGWLDPTEYPPQRGSVIPPLDPKELMTATPQLIEQGKTLFDNNCATCHGGKGLGDGPAATTMTPRPQNFTKPEGWVNGYQMPAIFKTLKEGIPGTSMAPFDYLKKKDRMALVHYVQSLGPFPHKDQNEKAMTALSNELASAGEKIPARIPVSMAVSRLEYEFAAAPVLNIDGKGADVFRKAATDPVRASQFLSQSKAWRASNRDLAAFVVRGMPANGFSISCAAMDNAEWQLLYSELLKRVK
jgi:mono/diheme cytochrome c family protein